MFKVNIVVVGRVKEKYYSQAIDEYAKRLSRFCDLTIEECKEQSLEGIAVALALERESEEIIKRLKGRVIVTAPEGKEFSSEEFSGLIKQIKDKTGEVTIVIGSSCGLSPSVKAAADDLISFSHMTFPHTLFRVMLFEQLYRAFMIGENGKYHK